MATSAFFKINDFVEQLCKGQHNFSTDTLKIALTNTDPTAAAVDLSGITQISTAGGYTTGGFTVPNVTLVESAGTATLDSDPAVFTATGTTDSFRYAVLYNDTPDGTGSYTTTDPLVGYYDYGSSITLSNTETFTVNVTTSIFTLSS